MAPRLPSLTAPSASLPPLLKLHLYKSTDVLHALQNLRDLYFSPFLASKQDKILLPMHHRVVADNVEVPDSGYASAEEEDDEEGESEGNTPVDADTLRADSLERAFAIRWLTGFLSRGHAWASADDRDEMETNVRLEIMDDVSSLLSSFSGFAEQDPTAVSRKFQFAGEDGGKICVELNDEPLSQEDHTSVGLQSWASSVLLAERMCASPTTFGLTAGKPLRILELGAGTGLLSIVTSKILPPDSATIIASDFHPDVLSNCTTNLNLNSCETSVLVRRLDWENPVYDDVFEESFDIILAADVIYHAEHARWIKGVVERVLVKTTSRHKGYFWLLIPMRTTGRHEGIYETVDTVFGESIDVGLVIKEREELAREKAVGRADESGYRLFKIGWA